MSNEKKPTKKEIRIMTMREMVDIEFNVPDVYMGHFDERDDREYGKWLSSLTKYFDKIFAMKSKHMERTGDMIDMMLIFLDKYPELFAENNDEVTRDMIKFSLNQHIIKCQRFIDKIDGIEKDLDLPIH
ncbi:MAG: hypothetical protein FWC00_01780 [Firmicutes bacterium]|nr:hypothetical protein [Bacillota bacterium]